MATEVKKINAFQVRTENALKVYREGAEINIYGNKFDGFHQAAEIEMHDRKQGLTLKYNLSAEEFNEIAAFLAELASRGKTEERD